MFKTYDGKEYETLGDALTGAKNSISLDMVDYLNYVYVKKCKVLDDGKIQVPADHLTTDEINALVNEENQVFNLCSHVTGVNTQFDDVSELMKEIEAQSKLWYKWRRVTLIREFAVESDGGLASIADAEFDDEDDEVSMREKLDLDKV